MYATNVRNLKKNPSLALRQAEETPVLVLKGDQPNALILHLGQSLTEDDLSLRAPLAATLFKDEVLSLGAAARLSKMPMQSFLSYLAELGVDVVRIDETTDSETTSLDRWLSS